MAPCVAAGRVFAASLVLCGFHRVFAYCSGYVLYHLLRRGAGNTAVCLVSPTSVDFSSFCSTEVCTLRLGR